MKLKVILLFILVIMLTILGCNQQIIINNNENKDLDNENEINYDNLKLNDNKQINSNNSGFVYKEGDWIYYTNTSDNFKLYKKNINTLEKVKLTDYPTMDIDIYNNKIYFYISTMPYGAHGKLASLNTDGTNYEKLTPMEPVLNY